jgi:hypothetical protein
MNTAGWILILFAHVGPVGTGNSNALTTAVYSSAESCAAAGNAAKKLAGGSTKKIEWVCTKQ